MTARPSNRRFAARARPIPIRGSARPSLRLRRPAPAISYTARLTVDVTPELRGRIKITAFQRGQTVADMLRDLLAREFPAIDGGQT